ncbi:uncharacterized protein LOC117324540 [Pecten maximus]|uniref:uncharacterized protein LOC117324540 n=1 Tax=Pecten maximus TaxID=6579 RepID=UPI0014581B95|nr:uncharacterized protein LOC117324540 [Pecten maximus]
MLATLIIKMELSKYLIFLCCLMRSEAVIPYPGDNAQVEDLVRYYFGLLYNSREICGFLLFVHGVLISTSTLKRMKLRLRLRRHACEVPLQIIIQKIIDMHRDGFCNLGYKAMWRLLNVVHGIRVTQNTVRACLSIMDVEGVYLRSRRCLRRRLYYSKGPNYLVHIDGYDKLKPFGVAIHGAIDGFSRKILWLKAGFSNNNPKLIANLYLKFIITLGRVPHIVRGDAGTENVLVKDLQTSLRMHHGDEMDGIRSYITARSSGNQRIERLWGTLRTTFTDFWRNKFQDMRDSGMLDTTNPLHIECIRFCYLPIIQEQLDIFVLNWNSHRIRAQRQLRIPHGIPDVLYHQPDIYETSDCSHPLPCNLETIDEIASEYTTEYPSRGCKDELLQILELATGMARDEIPRIQTLRDADEFLIALIQMFDQFNGPQ